MTSGSDASGSIPSAMTQTCRGTWITSTTILFGMDTYNVWRIGRTLHSIATSEWDGCQQIGVETIHTLAIGSLVSDPGLRSAPSRLLCCYPQE